MKFLFGKKKTKIKKKSLIYLLGKNFYIDLDMIVTGNIDKLLEYDGEFGILKTDEFECEKKHKGGYNSSIMMWNNNG